MVITRYWESKHLEPILWSYTRTQIMLGPSSLVLWSVVKTAGQHNSLCEYVGIPKGTSVYNDQHRLPSLSAHVTKLTHHQ